MTERWMDDWKKAGGLAVCELGDLAFGFAKALLSLGELAPESLAAFLTVRDPCFWNAEEGGSEESADQVGKAAE